jgi:uncharacterized membrane protein YgcG
LSREAIGSRTSFVAAVLVLALGLGGVALAQRSDGTAQIHVTLLDGNLTGVPTTFAPGKLMLVAANRGKRSHAIAIAGTGLQGKRTVAIASGKTATLTVIVKVGSYRIWDPLHSSIGHAMTLKVSTSKTTSSSAYSGQSTWSSSTGSKSSGGVTSGGVTSGSTSSGGGTTGPGMAGYGCTG